MDGSYYTVSYELSADKIQRLTLSVDTNLYSRLTRTGYQRFAGHPTDVFRIIRSSTLEKRTTKQIESIRPTTQKY